MQRIRHITFWCLRKTWQLVAITLVLLAVIISALKYSLPYANDYRTELEAMLNEQLGVDLRIGSISAGWERTGPALVLNDVDFNGRAESGISLQIAQTRLHLNLWQSSIQQRLVSNYFVLSGVEAKINMQQLSSSQTQGGEQQDGQIALLETLLLADSGHFAIENSQIDIQMLTGQERQVAIDRITWQNKNTKHQGVGYIHFPSISDNSIEVIFDLYGEHFDDSFGELYLTGSSLNITPWLAAFLPDNVEKLQSDINFQSWARFKNSGFENIQLNWQPSSIAWEKPSKNKIEIAQGSVRWYPTGNDWQIQTAPHLVKSNGRAWPELNVTINKDNEVFTLKTERLDLELVNPLTQLINIDQLAHVGPLSLQGQVQYLFLEYASSEQFTVATEVEQLAWKPYNELPGAQDIDFQLAFNQTQGRVQLNSEDNYLLTGDLFSQALSYKQLNLELDFIKEHGDWRVFSDQIWLHNEDLTLAAELDLRLNADPSMALYAEMYGPKALAARRYFPRGYMPQSTIDYLNASIKDGEVKKAQVLWQGAFSDFPYREREGQFTVKAEVKDAVFNFTPSWPNIRELDIELLFDNQKMQIQSKRGMLAGLQLNDDVVVSIEDLIESNQLYVDIETQQNGAELQPFFAKTPLTTSLGEVLEIVQGSGVVTGKTRISVPFESDKEISVNGMVTLKDNTVFITQPGIPFDNVTGNLHFNNETIEMRDISANWLGLPLTFSLNGAQNKNVYQLKASALGEWNIAHLLEQAGGMMSPYLVGKTPLQLDFTMDLPSQGFSYEVNVSSALTGLTSSLPAPYQKSEDQSWPLKIHVRGDEISNLVTASINNKLYFNSIIENEAAKMTNAHLILGQQDLGLNASEFDVSVNLDSADILDWIPVIDHIIGQTGQESSSDFMPSLRKINAKIDNASLSEIAFNDLSVELANLSQSTQLTLQAKELRAEVSIPKVLAQRPIYIETDYLRLNFKELPENADKDEIYDEQQDNTWLTHLPSIRFSCLDCKVDNYQLDKVNIDLDPAQDGIAISRLSIDKGKHRFNGQGRWQNDISTLQGKFDSKDIGELADEFDLTSSIKDSTAKASIDLSWQGTPYQFDKKSLNGEMNWQLGQGHLTDISDGGARVFSLLSLDSLVRKLKLDFRDVFSKGFFYNSMQGSVQLQDGIASTEDTTMDGVPADLTIKGYANLVSQEINYDMAVAPEVTSSIPVIVAWMVNPVTGLAALALDKVIHSARVISEIEFEITGTFENPVVTEKGRKSREVELPQVKPKNDAKDSVEQQKLKQQLQQELEQEVSQIKQGN